VPEIRDCGACCADAVTPSAGVSTIGVIAPIAITPNVATVRMQRGWPLLFWDEHTHDGIRSMAFLPMLRMAPASRG
jgi:hypothetical protein